MEINNIGSQPKPADVDEITTVPKNVEVVSGETIVFDSKIHDEIIFGRNPALTYEERPADIVTGVLPVKLVGTSSSDTSKQQFGIDRSPNGVFTITNYSKTESIHVDGQTKSGDLGPNKHEVIAQNTQGMQRVKVSWGRGHFEVSVNGVGSGSDNNQIDFTWNIK